MKYEDIEIEVSWEVEDGYAGKSRPQKTVFKPSDWMSEESWNDLDLEKKREKLEEAVQEDFEKSIGFVITDYGVDV